MLLGMQRIVDGVWEVSIGYVHAHVVEADEGLVLVDTGTPGKSGRIDGALRDIGRSVEDIRTILLTHWHFDHIGTLGEIVRRSGATRAGPRVGRGHHRRQPTAPAHLDHEADRAAHGQAGAGERWIGTSTATGPPA